MVLFKSRAAREEPNISQENRQFLQGNVDVLYMIVRISDSKNISRVYSMSHFPFLLSALPLNFSQQLLQTVKMFCLCYMKLLVLLPSYH